MGSNWYRNSTEWLHRLGVRTSLFWKGATLAILCIGILLWAIFVHGYFLTPPRWLVPWLATFGGFALAGITVFFGLLLWAIIYALPAYFSWSVVVAVLLMCVAFDTLDNTTVLILAAYLLPPVALFGAGLAFYIKGRWRFTGFFRNILVGIAFLASTVALVGIGIWTFSEGEDIQIPTDASATHSVVASTLESPDEVGPYAIRTLYYGSGKDIRRPEFNSHATIITSPIDGTAFVDDWYGWAGWLRTYYWGFGPDALPLNGRVYMPEGKGPFPLVVIVHGNSLMEMSSDAGYEYLGKLLASRGYIVASIDENFLNSSWHSLWQGISRNNARAWIILQHLKLWRDWNKSSDNPLFEQVDMNNVALIGHSRGGEAVALAAAFNRLPYYPDDCMISFDFNFGIRSVIAIAPVDAQYQPTGRHTPLSNINYLVMHGVYDGDVRAFQGASQYERVVLDDGGDWFKASLYIYGANHGQFNTKWGRYDQWPLEAYLLNVRPILPPEEQRRIAQVYVSAFLDSTLKKQIGYRELFRDHRWGGHWLPKTVYITQYADPTYRYISTFDNGLDVSQTSLPGGHQYGKNLTLWRQHEVCLKYGCMDTRAVFLGWDHSAGHGTPSYTIELPEKSDVVINPESSLIFVMADAEEHPIPNMGLPYEGSDEPVDLTVEVIDRDGHQARLPLSHCCALQPSLGAKLWKADFLESDESTDIVYQSFVFPLKDFVKVTPAFDPTKLAGIRFVFDRTSSWVIVLGDVGLRPY